MNICIGGDLDGQVVDLGKARFNASEVDKNKSSNYIKQKYIVGDEIFNFWRHSEMKIWDVTKRVESILKKKNN
ncbi:MULTISPECIES: hypothetical protein [Acinetobacter]|jgi:hypothetical protein|uniref:hypothetical protein n=1 Tax=Acinetobacter TaxID=469 RepID=UPI0007826778|nr:MULTISPECIES: hypothetical protein [Acinetobacter]UJA00771.1 hypothetical protein GBN93_07430 [Acinetobacter johnsonii]